MAPLDRFAVSLGLLLLVALSHPAEIAAQRFLGVRDRHHGALDSRGPADLLAELERLDRTEDFDHEMITTARVDRLEEALVPLFSIAPKGTDGRVDAAAARYALHRLFAQRHGWFVNGINLNGGIQNSSKVGEALKSGGRFNLRQLARFAATLETLVHAENIDRLQRVFDVLGFAKEAPRSDAEAQKAVEAYMMLFVGSWIADSTDFAEAERLVSLQYPSWADTKVFAGEIMQKMFEKETERGESLSLWQSCLRIVEEIGERYGRWQNKDCLELKSALLQLETPGTGRVPLSSFWGPLLHDKGWMFDESLPYLEQLGALEGSYAPHHSVVIPNYVYSAGNCLASSRYYDVCCINECETLLGEIEVAVDAPAATPQRIAELVAALPSQTVVAPRELPSNLLQRLDDIAARHGDGLVRLHGRLFAQFLHHAYPRECPYPHLSVSKAVQRNDTWITRQTDEASVSKSFVKKYMQHAILMEGNATAPVDGKQELPWTDEEDLFMHSVQLESSASATAAQAEANLRMSAFGLLLAVVVLFAKLLRPPKKGLRTAVGTSVKGYCV
eukprot:TRINITY_DN458_c0_g1_i2.p1 TRINITY_DN458_c0_g1~~TRINITY_DN458_c0_g1_i2.p1  ORF type:complete len:559 (-),score=125.30 TRINITY_DN458_c0_g1_i2:114-1790(-)